MDDKDPKTEEGVVSPEGASHGAVSPERLTGLQNAQHVTLNDKNKTKPNKDPGRVAAGKKLAECNRTVREEKKEKGGLKQSEDPGLEEESPEGVSTTDPGVGLQRTIITRTIIILAFSYSFSSKRLPMTDRDFATLTGLATRIG